MRFARRVALLVVLWLLAWGAVSVGHVLSGIVVATVLLLAFPPEGRRAGTVRLHPTGIARLVGHVTAQLAVSNVQMAREILRPHPSPDAGVLKHVLAAPSDDVLTVMTSIIALSPGTMTVDASADSSTVWVHFYKLDDVPRARAGLARLEQLVRGAIEPETHAALDPGPEIDRETT